jgi:hypothetical protein
MVYMLAGMLIRIWSPTVTETETELRPGHVFTLQF